MAHKTLIGGTAYDTKGGRCLVNSTGYDIKKGRTLIGGTGYDVSFGPGTFRLINTDTGEEVTSLGEWHFDEGMTWSSFVNSAYNTARTVGSYTYIIEEGSYDTNYDIRIAVFNRNTGVDIGVYYVYSSYSSKYYFTAVYGSDLIEERDYYTTLDP